MRTDTDTGRTSLNSLAEITFGCENLRCGGIVLGVRSVRPWHEGGAIAPKGQACIQSLHPIRFRIHDHLMVNGADRAFCTGIQAGSILTVLTLDGHTALLKFCKKRSLGDYGNRSVSAVFQA